MGVGEDGGGGRGGSRGGLMRCVLNPYGLLLGFVGDDVLRRLVLRQHFRGEKR